MNKIKSTIIYKVIEIILTISWLTAIKDSDSYFIPFIIVGVISVLCCFSRKTFGLKKPNFAAIVFAIIFTFFVTVANYNLFPSLSLSALPQFILQIISITIGSFTAFYNILIYTPALLSKIKTSPHEPKNLKLKPKSIFLISFSTITIIYLIIFFTCKYPGNLSFDSIQQITQGLTGKYANHHPFFSTIFIMAFVNLGQALFQNINAGVATFAVAQIIIMSLIFAFSTMTIYQKTQSKKACLLILAIYALTPYHIMYSMTVWKDVLFSGFILLFLVTQYRIFYCIGNKYLNYPLLTLSAILTCLYRGNGIYIIIVLAICFAIIFRKQIFCKKFFQKSSFLNLGILILAVLASIIFNSVTSSVFNIAKTEKMESLSIPAQQIARVVKDSNDLSEEQASLLSNIANLDEIPEKYTPWLADPMKEQVWRSNGGETFLIEHKTEFIKLYLELGIAHPIQYIQAWSDQTKGYFNGGYYYWVLENGITNNNLGIHRETDQSTPSKLFNGYLNIFENNSTLRIVYCIGFFVWITIWLFYVSIIQKDKSKIFLTLIPILLVGTLLIASPVFSEFRYIYPLLCCLPFLSIVIINQTDKLPFSALRQ